MNNTLIKAKTRSGGIRMVPGHESPGDVRGYHIPYDWQNRSVGTADPSQSAKRPGMFLPG